MTLKENLIAVIKESLIKLGRDIVPIGINYATGSLLNLLDTDYEHLQGKLIDFANDNKDVFGDIEIKPIDIGYCLVVSPEGVENACAQIKEDEFLVRFIDEVRNPFSSIDSIINVFKSYSDDVHIERTQDNPEFDYLIYFEKGEPDAFWYCIDTEDLGMTYHRFTKEDYQDFDF